jgi:hypothetical protein
MKNKITLFIALLVLNFGYGQTTLAAGEIAITGFNADNPDQFTFVLLTDVTTNTTINFTDRGWFAIGGFRAGEGTITWTATTALSCGTEITITDNSPFAASSGTVTDSGSLQLAVSGDQILAYQGADATPTFIYAVNFDGAGWSDAINTNTSAIPTGLINGTNAVDFGEIDNANYDCTVTIDSALILPAVSTDTNWTEDNNRITNLGGCQYFCSADTVDWCNLQFPEVGNQVLGGVFDVYSQVFEAGVTDLNNTAAGPGISAWVGFNTANTNPNSAGWTWVASTYNVDVVNNDEFITDIGAVIPAAGTYYYASRFQYNGGPYSYGGILANGTAGGFWDGTTYISGVLNISCNATTTWTTGGWDNGNPDINTSAIINDNYNTATNGSFSACSLTINAGFTLSIDNGDFVEVQTNIIADGNITVETQGAVVQIDDAGTVTGAGTIAVIKTTAPLNAWYEYTYWSSPVVGETIGVALSDADPDRRFWFNASNFQDTTMETGNNNATANGQDDIDDNGDDWQPAAGADIMTPGVGYAATHSIAAFIGPPFSTPPYQFDYNFFGLFNNGVITVPVVRNDVETADTNWNFIGNPYPSAIDVDAFFNTNVFTLNPSGLLDGTIYLWSQNTPPDGNTNGNEGQNFAQSDYATINGIATSAGGDMITPTRFIPSGQGFFVSFSDAQGVNTGDVIFNNSMRVTGNNDQFFRVNTNSKSKNEANKVWVNLTSDNGVFNQAVIGYVNGATNNYDGTYYDAPRNLSTGAAAILYTIIEENNKKFAIQGKAENSLTEDEVITIGFKTTIDVPTIYTLSIAQLEGDFLNGNPIYLKDNLLNTLHNLKDSDYNFTSTVGEFNNRFEIVFDEEALSLGDQAITPNDLSIIELRNGDVQFKLSGNLAMTSIQIIDLQGRILYNLKAEGNSKAYNLSNLSQAPYLAKVTLSNGYVITKKAVKRF